MNIFSFLLALALALASTLAFTRPLISQARVVAPSQPNFARLSPAVLMASDDGVVELADDDEASPDVAVATESKGEKVVAPFLSQGEISGEPVDLSDPKQARVMLYIILSLLPVLFLIPLMLGSRDLIPQDFLPPVELQ